MVDVIVDVPPSPATRVTELHCWVMVAGDGGESIPSIDLPAPAGSGTRHWPIMSSVRKTAERFRPILEQLQRELPPGRVARFELRTFKAVP